MQTWAGGTGSKPIPAHKGEVGSLFSDESKKIYSGGADGLVIIWMVKGSSLEKQSVFADFATISPTKYKPGIRSIDRSPEGHFLIGTRGSEIYLNTGKKDWNLLLQGHYDGEVWGCAASPNSHKFLSCGGDKTIRMWDAVNNKMLHGTEPLENDVR